MLIENIVQVLEPTSFKSEPVAKPFTRAVWSIWVELFPKLQSKVYKNRLAQKKKSVVSLTMKYHEAYAFDVIITSMTVNADEDPSGFNTALLAFRTQLNQALH